MAKQNIPTGIAITNDGRVIVGVKRAEYLVYSTLNYFNIADIKDGQCPPLKPYPSYDENELKTKLCQNPHQILSVDRFNIDTCKSDPKLWVVNTNGVSRDRKNIYGEKFTIGNPQLNIYNLTSNTLIRSVEIPMEESNSKGIGLTTVVIDVDPCSCENAYAYILDKDNGQIIVYSWAQNKVWKIQSPYFGSDALQTKFEVETPKGTKVNYFLLDKIFDATIDLQNQQLLFHAKASLNEFAISLEVLKNSSIQSIGPDDCSIVYVGQKNKNGQTGTHQMNKETQTVWGIQEQNYAITCWNRNRPLNSDAVKIVACDKQRLPFLADLNRAPLPGQNSSGVYVLTNNLQGVERDGLDVYQENFGIYYIDEREALKVNPECNPPSGYLPKPPNSYYIPSYHYNPYNPY